MKNKFSNSCLLIVALTSLAVIFNLKNWEERDRVIEWDIHGYYGYLPARFIYKDIKLEKSNYQFADNYSLFWPIPVGDGKNVMHKTMGLSILYAPFFGIGHLVAKWLEFPQNGFSEPYKLFLLLSAVFYLLWGLEFVRKSLALLYFSEIQTGLTILLLGIGTNLLAYSSQSAPMMHVYNFFLVSAFLYGTLKWYHQPDLKSSVLIGITTGLISMIYVPNLTILSLFIFVGISKMKGIKGYAEFLKAHIPNIIVILVAILIAWSPQLLYWKLITGKFIYSLPHEGRYFFTHPKFIDVLISFRKGWLVYTPLMILSLVGILNLKNKTETSSLQMPIGLFFIFNLFVVSSWWNWWYGGSFGQRAMIDSYAIMAIPLAALIGYVFQKNMLTKVSFSIVTLFFIWLNIFQTFQYENNSLHYEGMTKELYFKQFGKFEQVRDYNKFLDHPNYEEAKKNIR